VPERQETARRRLAPDHHGRAPSGRIRDRFGVRYACRAQVDKNVRKAGQFREVLAIGLTYRLF